MASTAPIYSLAGEARARAESAAWARFSSAKSAQDFCASWLAILCSQVERASGALLLLGPDDRGTFAAAAVWPDATRNMQYLAGVGERALKERRGVVVAADGTAPVREQPAYVGYPIEVSGTLHGAVILDLASGFEPELQRALRMVHWASAWLVDQFRQRVLSERELRLGRVGLATDIVATALQERRFAPSALAVVNELAGRLKCDRASIGFDVSGSVQVQALSHTATFDPKTNLVRLIAEAMEEVLDLDVPVVFPPQPGEELGAIAHTELAREFKDTAILSVPLIENGHALGVLTLERVGGEPFDAGALELCKTLGLLLGPILALKRENDRGEWVRLRETLSAATRNVFGPRHPGAKLFGVLAAGLLLFCSLVSGEYRVSARTVIEGAVQRAAVAPFQGYVAESMVRAGDSVKKGQVLCRLDDRDLKLEQTKLTSERDQALAKYRQAMASQDRAGMAVTAAQVNQSQAQLSLVEEKLARATLVAPFDGIVATGDLSQLLGTPVDMGKVLFEITPLDAYRVILKVDERDIAHLKTGQRGELALSGIPNDVMRFSVKQITPVSTAQEGRNYFRVEAQVDNPSERLRPGMEGVGKVSVGQRRLIWIWTHSLIDWLRVWLWKWMP
jgi:RND family efflux transporter MFP subunit